MHGNENNFHDLEEQTYTQDHPREQSRIPGQKSAIGKEVDTKDLKDMLRIWLLDVGTGTENLVGEISTDEDLFHWAKNLDEDWYMFPIRGSQGVAESEIGEIQGWRQFYPEDEARIKKMVEAGWIEQPDQYTRVFETSSIRLNSAAKGQVSAGLRQALMLLHAKVNEAKGSDAYQRVKYLITSYTDPIGNPEGRHVLEAAGFRKVGSMKYDADSVTEDDVYVLDWDTLVSKIDEGVFPTTMRLNELRAEQQKQFDQLKTQDLEHPSQK